MSCEMSHNSSALSLSVLVILPYLPRQDITQTYKFFELLSRYLPQEKRCKPRWFIAFFF